MQHEISQFIVPSQTSLHTLDAFATGNIIAELSKDIGSLKIPETGKKPQNKELPKPIDIQQVIYYIEKSGQNWKNVREAALHFIQKSPDQGSPADLLDQIEVSAILPYILSRLVKEASSTTLGWWNTLPFTPKWVELDALARMMTEVDVAHPSFCFIDVRPYHEHKLKRILGSMHICPRFMNQFCAQDQQTHEWNELNPTNTTSWLFESCGHLKNIVLYDNYGTNLTLMRRTATVLNLLLPSVQILCLAGGLRRFEERFFPLVFNLHSIRTPSFLLTLCEMSEYHFTPPIYGMSQILPNLFLGDEDDASNVQSLSENGITHVLCVADDSKRTPIGSNIKSLAFAISENVLRSNISFHLQEALNFIEEGCKEGKVLVHCRAGVNRSPTVILSYLMKVMGWSLFKALSVVKQGRPIIRPMGQFIQLLMTMEREIFGENSIDNFGFVTLLAWTYIRQNLIELSPISQS